MTLSAAEIREVNSLAQVNPYLWLLEVEVPTDPPLRYRLNNTPHSVIFGTNDDGQDLTYYNASFDVEGIRVDGQGTQYNATVVASNVSRELMAALEHYNGLIDQPAKLMLVHKALLASGKPLMTIEGKIIHQVARNPDIAIEIGQESLFRVPMPGLRVDDEYCTHPYGGALCGYDTTTSGAMQVCSFRREGPLGCRAHGDDEVANGLERKHPRRFGGHPGSPKRQGVRL